MSSLIVVCCSLRMLQFAEKHNCYFAYGRHQNPWEITHTAHKFLFFVFSCISGLDTCNICLSFFLNFADGPISGLAIEEPLLMLQIHWRIWTLRSGYRQCGTGAGGGWKKMNSLGKGTSCLPGAKWCAEVGGTTRFAFLVEGGREGKGILLQSMVLRCCGLA